MGRAPLLSLLRRVANLSFVRFSAVGVVNTGLSYATYAGLLALGLNFALANFGALVAGIFIAFQTQGRLVFGDAGWRRFPVFVAVWLLIYLLNIAVIGAWIRWGGINAYLAGLLALPVSVVCSFLAQRYVVFRGATRSKP
jgi:putative flippase GtrA